MLLKLSIPDDLLPQMPFGKTTKEIRDIFMDLYEMYNKSRTFFLKKLLFLIMIDEKTTLQAHLLIILRAQYHFY